MDCMHANYQHPKEYIFGYKKHFPFVWFVFNPCGAMPFSVTRKAMGGKNYPPSVGHISEPIQAPIFFFKFNTFKMRKIATKIRFLSYILFP